MNLSEQQKKQFVWALDRAGLSQREIAEHPLTAVSQPTVSRWLDDYDPVEDGFDASAAAQPAGEDHVFTEEQRETFRDGVFQILKVRSFGSSVIMRAEAGSEEPDSPDE